MKRRAEYPGLRQGMGSKIARIAVLQSGSSTLSAVTKRLIGSSSSGDA